MLQPYKLWILDYLAFTIKYFVYYYVCVLVFFEHANYIMICVLMIIGLVHNYNMNIICNEHNNKMDN